MAGSVETAFGAPLPGRSCGDCTACCVAPRIETPGLSKPEGVACPHLAGTGCGIYDSRFAVCRGFYCLWRRIGAMPEAARPDLCGVMFGHAGTPGAENPFERFYIHAVAVDGVGAFDTGLIQRLLAMFAEGDVPVWAATEDGGRMLVHPAPDIAGAVLSGTRPGKWSQRRAVREWRSGTRKRRSGLLAYFLQAISAE